ncbi:MAG TPA: M20 family metallopeptidase [Candidatus Limnocylindria bacterium]|nr:M20 family metallopeptidase [Candidatus Limnocylindria bacterium]
MNMDLQPLKQRAAARIDADAGALDRLALAIHDHPELGYQEHFASAALADHLAEGGFAVTRGAGGVETAFVAERKNGSGPTVAICAEYDALAGIGHGCGHNLIATAGVGAYIGAATVAGELRGTLRLIGTPAEEGGAGKVKLHAAGVFDGVDAAMMFHPADLDVLDPLMVSLRVLELEFRGKAAHAAAAPYAGVNALDALMLGWGALSALRQLVRTDSRIHGIVTDGGQAANIIPERAAAKIVVRAADPSYLGDLRRRVLACFEGAATATGAELRYAWGEAMDMVTTNQPLAAAFGENARALGRALGPRRPGETSGSTDMGNISSIIPSIHPFLSVTDGRVPWHSRDFAAASRTPRALETMHIAAKALAFTAIDLLGRPELLKQARAAFTPPRAK